MNIPTKRDLINGVGAGDGCVANSADDEPIFTLVARDRLAADTVRNWAHRLAGHYESYNHPKVVHALQIADAMDVWREAHGGGKLPD